jgi:hypothetical protein
LAKRRRANGGRLGGTSDEYLVDGGKLELVGDVIVDEATASGNIFYLAQRIGKKIDFIS